MMQIELVITTLSPQRNQHYNPSNRIYQQSSNPQLEIPRLLIAPTKYITQYHQFCTRSNNAIHSQNQYFVPHMPPQTLKGND